MSCTDDVTDLKIANAALRRCEAMLRNACHLAKIGTWELEVETRSLTCSDEVYAILGVAPDLIAHSYDGFTALIHPDDRKALCAELDDAIAGGPALDRVHRIVLPAGEVRTVRETAEIVEIDGRRVVVGVMRELTERRRTEAALRVSEERFRLIAQASNDVVWDWDLATDELWNSDHLAALLGAGPEPLALTRDEWLERIHPDDRARVRLATSTHLANATTSWTEEYRIARNDGTEAVVVDHASIIRDDSGRPIRVLGSLLDVTERRQLDQRLLVAERLEAVAQLSGGLAHDFNNLLTVILGNAEILADRIDDPDLRALTDMIATAAEHGAELTSRLLSFARRQVLQSRSVDVAELVDSMGVLLRRTLPETIDIAFTHAERRWPALVDPGQLEAAILNLAINARDAMPDGGRLTIDTGRGHLSADDVRGFEPLASGPYVVVAIADTGTGMSRETLARAFEPFFTTKEVGKGSGLGLAMVYGFAKQSGGHVAVTSKFGAGTTVKLFLPLAKTDGDATAVQPAAAPPVARGREHVLVVEDNELVRLSVTAQLRRLGYRVSEAASGAAALESMRDLGDVDLLFTDVVMPGGMDGAELARKAWHHWPALKVLFTSGYSESTGNGEDRLEASAPLLAKPYRRHDLAAKLREVLDADAGGHGAVPANQAGRCSA